MVGIGVLTLAIAGQADGSGNPRPEDVYCGSYSLFVALKALGVGPESFEQLERELGEPGPAGYSMLQLDEAARSYGAKTIAVETNLENLSRRPERFACLTVINDHHYVLLYKIEGNQVFVCDAPRLYDLPRETFEPAWSRKALLIGPSDFLPEEVISSRRVWARRGRIALATLAVLAFALLAWRIGRSVIRRRALAAAVLLAAAAAAVGCGDASGPTTETIPMSSVAGPSLIVEPEVRDLGRIAVTRPNQTVEGRATLHNVGDEPITIETLIPSCACTDVAVDPVEIEPGGTSRLRVTIRLVNNDNDGSTRVIIHSTARDAPVTEAGFVWEARNALRADVRSVHLPRVRPGAAGHEDVPIMLEHLGLCRDCEFRVAGDHPDLECRFEASFTSPSETHTRAGLDDEPEVGRLVLDMAASDELGHREAGVALSLACGDERRALLNLPVTWRLESAVAARPDRLYLGRYGPGDRVSRTLMVSSTEGKEFSILGVRCSAPDALVSAEFARRPAMTHPVEVEIGPPRGDGPWTGALIVDTDDEQAPHVTVPMAGLAAPGSGAAE